MRAADKSRKKQLSEEQRRNRARALLTKKADEMPVVEAPTGPRKERVVHGELVDPAPRGGLVEVFQNGYLLRLLVGRTLAQQYAASLLGLAWSYIQPALRFVVYYFIFGTVLKTHQSTPNFALHLFAGMVFVHYFSETWSGGTRSIWTNRGLVLKMRMPREIFPISMMLTAAYHTGPQLLILLIACLLLGWHVSLAAIAAGALGLAILVAFAMAMALLFSALNVYFRDFQNIVTTLTQFLHFMVPMMYPYSMIHRLGTDHPVIYQIYMANPLAEGVLLLQRFFWLPTIDQDRSSFLATQFPPDLWERGLVMLAVCLVLLYVAQRVFTRLESKFPERL